jgi:hypothetical protein
MKTNFENEPHPRPWVFSLTSIYKLLASLHNLVSSSNWIPNPSNIIPLNRTNKLHFCEIALTNKLLYVYAN